MSRFEQIRDILWPKGPRKDVWAVLDGARDPRIYSAILNSHNLTSCLYAGTITYALEHCAPHLVLLEYEDTRLTERLFGSAWGDSWGIFLRCDTSMEKLRHHLRRFLVVEDESGKRLVFRYHDPRVLRVFLPTCTATQLDEVYGPIECFWTEGDDPSEVLTFGRKGRALSQFRHRLSG
jgi:hypothetical protein